MKKERINLVTDDAVCFLNTIYEKIHKSTDKNKLTGGQQRGASGNIHEDFMYRVLFNTCILNDLSENQFEIKKGDSKGCGFYLSNPAGGRYFGLDKHLYINGKLVLINECKSYLDAAFMHRAWSYSEAIKGLEGHENVVSIVTALERSLDINTLGYYTYGNNIDGCFFFTQGQRSSIRPVYKREYWKPINKALVYEMVSYVDAVIMGAINGQYMEQGI